MNPKRSYQETAVRGANPVRLTILLYDQLIQDVSRAGEALATSHIEQCAQEVGHAVAVIGYLQATLRHDGGRGVLREKLMEAQVRSSIPILADLRQQLAEVREAWVKVEAETVPAEQ